MTDLMILIGCIGLAIVAAIGIGLVSLYKSVCGDIKQLEIRDDS